MIPPAGSSNWLDRLRSSRGFPPVNDLDLGSFLATQTPHDLPKPREVSPIRDDRRNETVSEILCDLFAMGDGKDRVRGKSLRKQRNPSYWGGTGESKKSSNGGVSSDDLGKGNVNGLASSGDNSLNRKSVEDVRVEEDEEVDLKEYSKSEVTVVDSSVEGWKSEVCVYRKGRDVWKVREMKGKLGGSMSVRKKRKLAKADDGEGDDDEKKRKKEKKMVRVSDSGPCSSSGNGKGDQQAEGRKKEKKKEKISRVSDSGPCSSSGNGKGDQHAEGQLNHDKVDGDALLGTNGEAPTKSVPCSISHWKMNGGTSSVVLVRPDSTFDKIGARKPGKISIDGDQNPL